MLHWSGSSQCFSIVSSRFYCITSVSQMKESLRGDRLEDSPMRNSSVGYKPTVPFRKIYGRRLIVIEEEPPVTRAAGVSFGGNGKRKEKATLRVVRLADIKIEDR
jgi:hypothetical protein